MDAVLNSNSAHRANADRAAVFMPSSDTAGKADNSISPNFGAIVVRYVFPSRIAGCHRRLHRASTHHHHRMLLAAVHKSGPGTKRALTCPVLERSGHSAAIHKICGAALSRSNSRFRSKADMRRRLALMYDPNRT